MTEPTLDLERHVKGAYLSYAMSVVTSRALPTLRDGQKPVQRRILYDMHMLGLVSTKKPVKSARFVGDILAKYHPHGDSSVYDAAVRMSQDFMMRYPLVDGHGNFGSRDGDGAAAMRYTEARLTPIAELLLGELDMGTVDFAKNYDGTITEPTVLPARVPMMLLNGASGIAVGMATEIPSHNLTEVVNACELLLRNPEATLQEVMELVPGPDFPAGGQIIATKDELEKVYTTGKGPIGVRARWVVEPLARGQWQIAFFELPPGTSTASILQELEDLTNPQIKPDKKTLTPEQLTMKSLLLSVIESMHDESDVAHPIRLVIQPKSSRLNPEEVLKVLLANTSLECNFSANMVMLRADGTPAQVGLMGILQEWLEFRYTTVRRRTEHRLAYIHARTHILEGRLTTFDHLDEILELIRTEETPKDELMRRYALSDIQATDILEIRLRQLARLEQTEIQSEHDKLTKEKRGLDALLASKARMRDLLLSELEADRKKYGDARRTLIEASERVTRTSAAVAADDPVTLIITRQGWLRARVGHRADLSTLTWKPGDEALSIIETRTNQTLVIIDGTGRAYNVMAAQIPTGRGDGIPLSSLCTLESPKLLAAFMLDPAQLVFFASDDGYGFLCPAEVLATRQKAGKAVVSLQGSAQLLSPVVLANTMAGDVVVGTTASKMLVFPADELKVMPKARGLQLISLREGDTVTSATITTAPIASLTAALVPGLKSKLSSLDVTGADLDKYRGKRGRAGGTLPDKSTLAAVSVTLGAPRTGVNPNLRPGIDFEEDI